MNLNECCANCGYPRGTHNFAPREYCPDEMKKTNPVQRTVFRSRLAELVQLTYERDEARKELVTGCSSGCHG
jgi:hypothetical protein